VPEHEEKTSKLKNNPKNNKNECKVQILSALS
jgi:hypothetical protein